MAVQDYFSQTYAEARKKFIKSAQARGLTVQRVCHPERVGSDDEILSIDSALYSPENAESLLVLTSGTHGVEGFCGSGCQVGMLNDSALFDYLNERNVALLLIHAVNPYGFSHMRRVNEDNVDLNRNSVDFEAMGGSNLGYDELDPVLLPATWPPTDSDNAALMGYIQTHGEQAFRDVMTKGQYRIPDGMFYGGNATCWSTREVRAILSRYAPHYERLVWVDIHTGLGAYGHGEKIFMSEDALELRRALSFWGADVKPVFEPGSISSNTDGPLMNVAYDACPALEKTTLALEFGTLEPLQVMQALRADHWLHRQPESSAEQSAQIKRKLKDAFYCDSDEWKGLVYGQTRVLALQSIAGLSRS